MAGLFERGIKSELRSSMPRRILIADDHESVLRRVRAMIESQPDWQICADAVNGREAIRKAIELNPDAVILDFAMPQLDGLKTASEINKLLPDVPIIMFSMYATQLREEVQKHGICLLIDKTNSGDLVTELEKLFEAQIKQREAEPPSATAVPIAATPHADVRGDESLPFRKVS